MRIDDETISAYLDGELPEEERARVAEAIARSDALAARLHAFEAAHLESRALLGEIDARPLPEAVERLIAESDRAEAAEAKGGKGRGRILPLRWRDAARTPLPGWSQRWGMALAASLALLIGFGAGLMTGGVGDTPASRALLAHAAGTITPAHPLYAALQETPSGRTRQLDGGAGLRLAATPVLSFRTEDGRYCRELAVTADGQASRAVLCRSGDADWRIQALAAAAPASEGYTPAAGEAPRVIEESIDGLIAGAPLDAAAEAQAIESGWTGAGAPDGA